ncbi:MAG: bifunctional proline dehydrogenase/L-glutamate gamma-semialdehyde dehydrogenase PutA [Rhizobiaceae bacterium]|nr:bifunctional proline dehydrogenase/L-glutamate gamma-semialdehyde dehydrogenase PutA [Rhizobiaceae bacterium]
MTKSILEVPIPFSAEFAPEDGAILYPAIQAIQLDDAGNQNVVRRAREYIQTIRDNASEMGGVEDFLRVYGLSTSEGLALMILAEALLRVPDAATQDKLIEDKLKEGNWVEQHVEGEGLFVTASAWALALTARVIKPGETPEGAVSALVKRVGMPTVRTATKQAMRFLGHHFVLGEAISDALSRARTNEKKGYRHSFDMLGEGARTAKDAKAYWHSYADAIDKIGKTAGNKSLPDRPGISVKLSALHPSYQPMHQEQIMRELVPDVLALAQKAKSYDLNFTIDAEEADRLELSLDVISAVFSDDSLRGWDGFGLAIQAYQKRAGEVIDYVDGLCEQNGSRMMVRLVKGAYWDTEVKRAQERGLGGFPVFTRKPATDVNFLACAQQMLGKREWIFPQFATHNALTVASILELAGGDRSGFEFQRLHGMGEELYRQITEKEDGIACRIYAPVGGYSDLLAYLVRRLLENGANSSFVAVVGDENVPIDELLEQPEKILRGGENFAHSGIRLPSKLYKDRANSKGFEFGDRVALGKLIEGLREFEKVDVKPLVSGLEFSGTAKDVISPADMELLGSVVATDVGQVDEIVNVANAGFKKWKNVPAGERAVILEKFSDQLELNRDHFINLLSREAGKTLDDGIAEIREAVDFCRFYANEARRLYGAALEMPGPTGEENLWSMGGRGAFVCISPWNFPLAIFLGQVTAALAAGNSVIAKPAEQTPLVAYEAVRLLHEVGVPEDVLLFVPGDGKIGAALTKHVAIGGVAFTGSTQTAWAINKSLAARKGPIVPLIAETGGINAMIVDATALPEQVADDVVMSAFRSAGQRCSALRLLFLQESVADRMLEMIEGAAEEMTVGHPLCPQTEVGPIIDKAQRDKLQAHVDAMGKSQKLRFAGSVPREFTGSGTYFPPHIIELETSHALEDEVFGPVLHVVRWKQGEIDGVVDAIKKSGLGLTFGIHSRIETTIEEVVAQLDVGNIYVNRNTIGAIVGTQPFGGSGLSGTGPKAGGPNYLARFGQEQVVSTNTAAAGGNASLIAIGDG